MTTTDQSVRHSESRIFGGFRSLGHVSNSVPALVRYIHRRRENFIVTVIGKSFNTYASQKLKHLSVSGTLDYDIGCMAVDTYHVYTGAKNKIYAWRRGTEIKHVYLGHDADVSLLLPFGNFLLSIDEDGKFCMFDIKNEECVWQMHFPIHLFKPTSLMHPATYMNKILVGSQQGEMELWNISKASLIHHFEGWEYSINQIVQAPAVDVVAVALSDKRVIIFNLLMSETIMELKCIDEPISLAFRTDGFASIVVGSREGSITLWDLEDRAVICFVENVHDRAITGLQCFPQEPIFITSSADNSLKAWIFDMPDGSFRLLNSRDGHSKPSNRIRFHGTKGYNILSAGQDSSFRIFHIYNETYNRCLSKTHLPVHKMKMQREFDKPDNNRMPPILDFTTQTVANPSHHEDIAACHQGQVVLSTWSFANTKKGNKSLVLPKYKSLPKVDVSATCLCITSCGQFVLSGYSNGTLEKFNIQSGLHRKSYGNPAHSGAIRGVAIDQVNYLVVSGGSDGMLKFWDFKSGALTAHIELSAGISYIFFHRMTSLVGAVLDDFTILIVDIASAKVFRRFTDISSQVLNACFSPDNRWVTASTSDCLIRTYDLPTSKMVDIFRLESIVSSMDYSPNGEFLATTLHDNIGILLWMNKTLFVHVSLMPIPTDFEPPLLELCHSSVMMECTFEETDEPYVSPEQINEDLITLSLLPASRWKNLLNLDVIKMRNKPKQPPKTYVAPFFLSSMIAPSEPDSKTTGNTINLENSNSTSKILKMDNEVKLSTFVKKLLETEKTANHYDELCEILGEMGPSRIDSEIESLGPLGGGSDILLKKFIEFIDNIIKSNRFFENSQAYFALFIKKHGDTIQRNDELLQALEEMQNNLSGRINNLSQQVNSVLAFTFFLKSTLF